MADTEAPPAPVEATVDATAADGAAPAAEAETYQFQAEINQLMSLERRPIFRLEDKQRAVLERRFGLNGHEKNTLEEVGRELGVTRERVRQIQMEALKRLRRTLEGSGYSADSLFTA